MWRILYPIIWLQELLYWISRARCPKCGSKDTMCDVWLFLPNTHACLKCKHHWNQQHIESA